MLPPLEDHEIVRWEHPSIAIKLSASGGTTVRATDCKIRLTNKHIVVGAKTRDGVPYNVRGLGDRAFHGARIPLVSAKPHRFIQPWFGPYKWETMISGPAPDGLEPQSDSWTLELTMVNGGAFEYREVFLRLYAQAEQAKQEGMEETLPAYSEF